jgi:hypothetical protein
MSIISQLWTAVTGDGAEKANDVCPPPPPSPIQGACDFPPQFSHFSCAQPFPPADDMPHQTDNAYSSAASPLPPNPFPRDLPATSRHSPEAAIDLTSPPQSPRDSEQRRARAGRPVARNRRSADEKRLFGDYEYGNTYRTCAMGKGRANMETSIPADSVSAPHPASYFQSPRPAMGNGKVCF